MPKKKIGYDEAYSVKTPEDSIKLELETKKKKIKFLTCANVCLSDCFLHHLTT